MDDDATAIEDHEYISDMFCDLLDAEMEGWRYRIVPDDCVYLTDDEREMLVALRESVRLVDSDRNELLRMIGISAKVQLGRVSREYRNTERILAGRAEMDGADREYERRERFKKLWEEDEPSAVHLFLSRMSSPSS